jgi:hypothetical protein
MQDIREARDPAMRGSRAALQRAAEVARRIAIKTDTDLVLMHDGKLCRFLPEELAKLSWRPTRRDRNRGTVALWKRASSWLATTRVSYGPEA